MGTLAVGLDEPLFDLTKSKTPQGKVYLAAYKKWCVQNQQAESGSTLKQWDIEHNLSRFRKLYSTDDDVWETGLDTIYTRILFNYTKIRANMPDASPDDPPSVFARFVKIGGERADRLGPLTKEQRNYQQAKAARNLLHASNECKIAALTHKQAQKIFDQGYYGEV